MRKLESLEGMLDILPTYDKASDVYGVELNIKMLYNRSLDPRYRLETDTEYNNYLSVVNDIIRECEEGLKEGLREVLEKTIDRLDKEIYYNLHNIKDEVMELKGE